MRLEISEAAHRWAMKEAIANTVIEGHVPTPEVLADCEAVVSGRMTHEQLRARSLARALGKETETVASPGKCLPIESRSGDRPRCRACFFARRRRHDFDLKPYAAIVLQVGQRGK